MFRKHRARLLVSAVIIALALGLNANGNVLAQALPQLESRYTAQPLPVADPASTLWAAVPALELPLTAQVIALPTLLHGSISSVRVRSLNDGQRIAFLLEWKDNTKDTRALRPDEFRDAAAIQFPVDTATPGVCMGFRGKPVNLWHWKADWQEDIDQGYKEVVDAYPNFWKDYYPFAVGKPPYRLPTDFNSANARAYLVGWAAGNPLSDPFRVTPMQELAAMGFGTAEHKSLQTVLGRGVWSDNTWRVVYTRPLSVSDPDAVQFLPGGKAYVAFAVWNGSNQEVGARKQVTADIAMNIQGASEAGAAWWVVAAAGAGALLVGAGAVWVLRRPGAAGA